MEGPATRSEREATLQRVEAQLADDPDSIELRFARAGLLAALGHSAAARAYYLALLERVPDHYGALNDFATMLYRDGYRSAARTLYQEAALRHPDRPTAHVNLGNLLLAEGAFDAARRSYAAALALAPALEEAHQGLAQALSELGDEAAAERHRVLGFHNRYLTALPHRGSGEPVPLLLLVSARGGNIATRSLVDDGVFGGWAVVPEFFPAGAALPPHRLVVNLIGDADRAAPALEAARALIARTAAPVINDPARVLATTRLATAERLAGIPGVTVPRVAAVTKPSLAEAGGSDLLARLGLGFPLLVRSPGFHTGRNFIRVERAAALAEAVAALPGESLLAIEFCDVRGNEGFFRKYRVMLIDGEVLPLHLAVATQWKVHYYTADMATMPLHRAEEARFLADPAQTIGAPALAALGRIGERLGLDYAGIDFAVGLGGEVIVFEANAAMVVNPPDADPMWDYRRDAASRVQSACRTMLLHRAAVRSGP